MEPAVAVPRPSQEKRKLNGIAKIPSLGPKTPIRMTATKTTVMLLSKMAEKAFLKPV